MKRNVLKAGLLVIVLCHASNVFGVLGIDKWDTKGRVAGAFVLSACTLYGGSWLAKSEITRQAAPWCNLDPKDMGAVVGVTATLGAASLFCDDDTRKAMWGWALQVPCLALSCAVMQSKFFNKLVKNAPLVGKYLACKNKDCQGICQECKCRKGIVQTFVWSTLVQQMLYRVAGNQSDGTPKATH